MSEKIFTFNSNEHSVISVLFQITEIWMVVNYFKMEFIFILSQLKQNSTHLL